jgi:hypothetical protein
MNSSVVEKDFWVCWVLKQLFADPDLKDQMVFKGGTSLSKVFGLINRFSEDIDLILDWRLLGYEQEDPYQEFSSNNQRNRFNKIVNERAAEYISDTLIHQLDRILARCPGTSASVDTDDPHTVNIVYPAAFSEDYLRPEVRLEIGPLASWFPSNRHTIQPYAAEVFPEVFDDPSCPVVAIDAERSFWEKATILHQQAHRLDAMPPRYSRHYYDLYKLASSGVRDTALSDLGLLREVVEFKQRFYPCRWAQYENARPGSFRLIPPEKHLTELRKDYIDMGVMIFEEIPDFESIIKTLSQLENQINELGASLYTTSS